MQTETEEMLIGTIKAMNRSQLNFATSFTTNPIQIRWDKIRYLTSYSQLRLVDRKGDLHIGKIYTDKQNPDWIWVKEDGQPIRIHKNDIVEIGAISKTFIDRLSLGLNFGYNYTKGNATRQIAVRAKAQYTASRWSLTSSMNSYSTIIDTIKSRRSDAHLDFKYFLAGDWFTMAHLDWLQSEEQQLDLRTTGIIGIGGYFLRTQTILCYLVSGAAFNHETFTEGIGTFRSWEGFGKLSFDVFGTDQISLISSLWAFPGISEQKRMRLAYHLDLKWAFLQDFNAKLGYTLNYDNRPPDGAGQSDYVVSFTLGWEL